MEAAVLLVEGLFQQVAISVVVKEYVAYAGFFFFGGDG
jgi:hypothetical protein